MTRAAAVRMAAALALAACSGCGGSSASNPWTPYAAATLASGGGLGDLALGSTTLQDFLMRFPGGRTSVTVGDVAGIEVDFPEQRLAFLFELAEECATAIGSGVRQAAAELRNPAAFATRYPACATAPLRSVSARAGDAAEHTFFTGLTDQGAALWTTRADLLERYGPPHDVRGLWVAGASPDDARYEELAYLSGIVFSLAEAASGPAAGHLVVMKIAVFPPGR